MQFDFVLFLFKKTFLRRKISLFFIRNLCMEYIFVPLQSTFDEKVNAHLPYYSTLKSSGMVFSKRFKLDCSSSVKKSTSVLFSVL